MDPDPMQPVEHRLARLELHLMGFPAAGTDIAAAPDRDYAFPPANARRQINSLR